MDHPALDPRHHDRVPQGGIGEIEVHVPRRIAAELLVALLHVRAAQEIGDAVQAEELRDVLEEPVQEHEPAHVQLAGAERGHLPVEHGNGLEALVDDVADSRVAPAEHVGPAIARPMILQPAQAPLDDRHPDAVISERPAVIAGLAGHMAPKGVQAGRRAQTGERRARLSYRMQLSQNRDAGVLQPGTLGRRSLQQPAREHIGRVVQRNPAVDLVHDEERRAERAALRLVPPELRQRDAAARGHLADHLELSRQVITGKHRHGTVFGRHPGHVSTALPGALADPARLEQRRCAGQPAAAWRPDPAHRQLSRPAEAIGQPVLERRGECADAALADGHLDLLVR